MLEPGAEQIALILLSQAAFGRIQTSLTLDRLKWEASMRLPRSTRVASVRHEAGKLQTS